MIYFSRLSLYYFNARWYDASTGRFISEDPIKDGLNWYRYASNNPMGFIDPSGKNIEDPYENGEYWGNSKPEIDLSQFNLSNKTNQKEKISDHLMKITQGVLKDNPGLLEGLDEKSQALALDTIIHLMQLYLWSEETKQNWDWGKFGKGALDQTIDKGKWLLSEGLTFAILGPGWYGLGKGYQGLEVRKQFDNYIEKNGGFLNVLDMVSYDVMAYVRDNPEEVLGRVSSEIVQTILISKGLAKLNQISAAPNVFDDVASGGIKSWNEFQSATKGMFSSRADASAAWNLYKSQNGIVTGTFRNMSQRSTFLNNLMQSGKAPKWMNQWLQNGKVPPGYQVDHIMPLSIGGPDTAANMRLLLTKDHAIWHTYYYPWR